MQYGGITLDHVLAFQIRIMMGNQYRRLVNAMRTGNKDELIVACLRLGWNDAFRHVSENIPDAQIISQCTSRGWLKLLRKRKTSAIKIDDGDKDTIIVEICRSLCDEFKAYASQKSTVERHAYIHKKMDCPAFTNKFAAIKVIDPKDSSKYLCFGHIQKMFNMAIKIYLCLKICAEAAPKHDLQITLQYGATPDETVALKPELFDLLSGEYISADCPIDHYILEAIDSEITLKGLAHTPIKPRNQNVTFKKFGTIAWSKLNASNDTDYIDIQDEIAALQNGTGKCNLCFDFENWNS